jgi:2'-5' RNA ligase
VPEAEPLVGAWRERYDAAARTGVPAHITLLYPFLPPARIGADVLRRLTRLFAAAAPIRFELGAVRRFPGILYLEPRPSTPMRDLTHGIWALHPETPPYGGLFPEVVPHLTVAQVQDPALLDEVEAAVAPGLPIAAHVTEAWLMIQGDSERWRVGYRFPLG